MRSGPEALPPVAAPFEELSLEALRRRTSAKWRVHAADVLPLWIAEMDVRPAAPIIATLTQAISDGDTGYPYGEDYAQALQGFAARRWGWEFALAQTSLMPDVMRGAVEIFRLVTYPGDAVVINPPVYPPFYDYIRDADRRVVEAPLGPGHRLDIDALDRAFWEATSGGRPAAYLLCNPQNPTGTVHSANELGQIAALAGEHGVRVVSDEIHAPLVLDRGRFVPYLAVPGTRDAVALHSASKAWNLAGLKAAVAVFGEGAMAERERLPEIVSHGPSHLGVLGHTTALSDGEPWLDQVLAGIDSNQQLLAQLLADKLPTARYQAGDGTYLAWVDCRQLGLGDHPGKAFLEHGRVAFIDGPEFGPGGIGHVRVNLATSATILREAVERMVRTVDAARP